MIMGATVALVVTMTWGPQVLEDRIDLYDPTTSAFEGSEVTYRGADGRRLRLEIRDAAGAPKLLFFVLHDENGREAEAVYFEGDTKATRETFSYSEDGLLKTTTYFYEPGIAADRTESVLDGSGREIRKRYYRADGTQYGEEDVRWNDDGSQAGWDFRYVDREGGTSFRYEYLAFDEDGEWLRRIRGRDGEPERIEVRTQVTSTTPYQRREPLPFAREQVSTGASETSPSFSRDGRTMVFARYRDDWNRKEPYIARLGENGWEVERLSDIGPVYNLAVGPDGQTLLYSTQTEAGPELHRVRWSGSGWSKPQNLTHAYDVRGTYPALTDEGALLFFEHEGDRGAGVYRSRPVGEGFLRPDAVFVPSTGTAFDPFPVGGSVILTWCVDDPCETGTQNGIWEIPEEGADSPKKLDTLPYAWGFQPVPSLGIAIFTDGEEILALPLSWVRPGSGH
ncbi:MAG: hypothetical protein HKN73_15900 [Gemmatimonadetes bacterium]|nr:hypothetical protein [Gemmatimonadota bacterium]